MIPSPPSGQTSVPPGDVLQRGGRVWVDRQVLGHVVIEARVDELRVPADVVDPVDVRHDHLPVPPDNTVQEQVPVLLLREAEGQRTSVVCLIYQYVRLLLYILSGDSGDDKCEQCDEYKSGR